MKNREKKCFATVDWLVVAVVVFKFDGTGVKIGWGWAGCKGVMVIVCMLTMFQPHEFLSARLSKSH